MDQEFLLLRDKFNKSLIIFKIDAKIFIYTENEYLDDNASKASSWVF